jgi:hypothetical protein
MLLFLIGDASFIFSIKVSNINGNNGPGLRLGVINHRSHCSAKSSPPMYFELNDCCFFGRSAESPCVDRDNEAWEPGFNDRRRVVQKAASMLHGGNLNCPRLCQHANESHGLRFFWLQLVNGVGSIAIYCSRGCPLDSDDIQFRTIQSTSSNTEVIPHPYYPMNPLESCGFEQ